MESAGVVFLTSQLETRREDRLLILTINGPETRNSLSPEIYSAGVEALASADRDGTVRAVVLTGSGSHFCSGGSLPRLKRNRELGPQAQRESIDRLNALVDALRTCSKPVIAAVEGAAAGAGCSLALNCDFIVAGERAKFIMAYVNVGLSPDGGGTWHWVRSLPRPLAAEILMLGTPVSAARLHEFGLINRVVANGQALTEAIAFANELCERPSNVLASVKELVAAAQVNTLTEQLSTEREAFVENLYHPNAAEGIEAFLSKRTPRFDP